MARFNLHLCSSEKDIMKLRISHTAAIVMVILLFLFTPPNLGQAAPPLQPPPGNSNNSLIDQLKQNTKGQVRISYHELTGQVRFIGTSLDQPIPQPSLLGQNVGPEVAGRGFLAVYGRLFGLSDPATELTLMREEQLADGRRFVRFQQQYQNIPVIGGELIVQTNRNQAVLSASGEVLPNLTLGITPTVTAAAAQQTALGKVAKDYGLAVAALTTTPPELWIYDPALLEGPGPLLSRLVWRMEVTPKEILPIREFVLVDAQLGHVSLQFNQLHTALNRVIYDNNNDALGLPGNGPVRNEGGPASSITDVNLAYDYSGDTYDFFFNEHGRNSLDDAGQTLISTTRYCPNAAECPYQNAFWNGIQMVYGAGFAAADDVVGHELTHGVTEFSSHLFYFHQSGSINESFSDVWGEFIDQTNGAGSDDPIDKWLMGEDVPGLGAIRNMADPTTFNDPDQMTSFLYQCDDADSGGVHTNSGVNNKAVFLMTDGGMFNGLSITGLGIPKVADLYYEAQTNMLVSGSNYRDLYDALIQASINLGFTTAQRQAVKNALDAVKMSVRPCGDPTPLVNLCPTGLSPANLFYDNLENTSSGNWVSAAIQGGNGWYYPQNSHPFSFDATYASSGVYNFWGYDQGALSDSYIAMTSAVTLPAEAHFLFRHDWSFEDNPPNFYDGGVVEYSLNGGATWLDTAALFSDNGYNGAISAAFDNPLGGRQAFVAEGHGYTASRLDLNSLANQAVQFRFRLSTDSAVDDFGWFIDDVQIYTCQAPTFKGFLPVILKN